MNNSLFLRPKFQVTATWLWFILLPLSLVAILVGLVQLEISTMRGWWSDHLYYQGYFEAALAGLLPVIFFWLNKEPWAKYGLRREKLGLSVGLGLGITEAYTPCTLSEKASPGCW